LIISFSPEHEGVESVSDREVGEFIDPLIYWAAKQAELRAVSDLPVDVDEAADVRRIPAGRRCRLVEARGARCQRGEVAA
jgi:hypothetical protein